MGKSKKHLPVKLIIGFIFKKPGLWNKAKKALEKRFGEIDFESTLLDFIHTDYYEKEMGEDLKKVFISFKKPISPQDLAKIKIRTIKIENRLSFGKKRTINIDPGYLELSKLVFATTKDFKHRIYLSHGIFAEVTLFYDNKSFKAWEWTYPDYRSQEYINIFNKIREIYARQIKNA
ncbi:MAG: DUF4416 family protein [Candidatus Omnitrophota bacterium]